MSEQSGQKDPDAWQQPSEQPRYEQPQYEQPRHEQPGYPQSGDPQPGYPQPGYPQPGYPQPGYPQQGSGYPQSSYPQQGSGYPQPGYPSPYGYGPPPTNVLAIVTIVLAVVFSPAGIITGHLALGQIRQNHEQGQTLAKTGLILSYVFTGLWLLVILLSLVVPFVILLIFATADPSFGTEFSQYS